MFYINFSINSYQFYSNSKLPLFELTNPHEDLITFIYSDLSSLPQLLEEYISQTIDLSTLEILQDSYIPAKFIHKIGELPILEQEEQFHPALAKIFDILKNAHPYYRCAYREIVATEIATYFNTLLAYLVFGNNTLDCSFTLDEGWYMNRLSVLIPYTLLPNETFCTRFFSEYKNKVEPYMENNADWEFFIPNVIPPNGFTNELRLQHEISNMIYFLLDSSDSNFKSLSSNQRLYLYNKVFHSEFDTSPFFPLSSSLQSVKKEDDNKNDDENGESTPKNIFSNLYSLRTVNILNAGIPKDMEEDLSKAIEHVQKSVDEFFVEQYAINSFSDFIYIEIKDMIRSNIKINKCKNCGLFFIITDKNKTYCTRIFDRGLTCAEVGPNRAFANKLKENEASKLYNRAYKTHYARIKGKINSISRDDFAAWRKEAQAKLKLAEKGELDLTTFEEWLKK